MVGGKIEIENLLNSKGFFDNSFSEESRRSTSLLTMENEEAGAIPSTSDYLVSFSTQSQSCCVGYVDIVNSTKISASLPADKLPVYYGIFLNSMSKIIGKLGDKVIKNIGDCLLDYFPESTNSSEQGIGKLLRLWACNA